MNMHVPQNIETSYELENITMVPKQIISPAKLKPIIYVVQDCMSGSYLFTQPFTKISKQMIFNLMMANKEYNGILPKPDSNGEWSGQDVFTMILPDISIKTDNDAYDDYPVEKNKVNIENGIFKNGVLDAKLLGGTNHSLVYIIYNTYGPQVTKKFLNDTQRIITRWFTSHGFSIGVGDAVPKKTVSKNVETIIQDKVRDVNTLIKKANQGTYNPKLDQRFMFSSLEQDIKGILNDAMRLSHKEVKKSINEFNRFNITVTSGAKGGKQNIGQIMAVVGQQDVEGKRISFGYTKRTLPHFSKDDYGAISKGFVKNPYIYGLEPIEVFFHQMGGRTGLIDTAIKTAESGYIQRRLIKAMEDLCVKYGGTVRNAANNIVQFTYGDDSIDPTRLEKLKLPILSMNNAELEKEYLFTEDDISKLSTIMEKSEYNELIKDSGYKQKLQNEYDKIYGFRKLCRENYFKHLTMMDSTIYSPVNLYRVINSAKDRFHVRNYQKTNLSLNYINESINQLIRELNEFVPRHSLNLFEIMVNSYLSPKVSIVKNRFSKLVFDYIINTIREKYISSLVQPGEMVGIIAAQSIGETTTQMTLNSVEWNTEILIKDNESIKRVKIGEWIDKKISNTDRSEIETHPNDTTLAYTKNIEILACTEDGKIIWDTVEAVTKHPPINEDGSNTLIKVTTFSGREVIATKAKSFLKRVDNKIVAINGSELKLGDYVPVSKIAPLQLSTNTWNVNRYLNKNEWIYMSEVKKALQVYYEEINNNNRHWWKKNSNKFSVPYKRSDSFLDAFGPNKIKKLDRILIEDCVYPIKSSGYSGNIPENIILDNDFGFIIGAYLSEGHCTKYQVLISNIDETFNQRILNFCEKYKLNYHIDEKNINNGVSKTIRIHSYVLAQLFMRSIGATSGSKRIPIELIDSNMEFLRGLLDGYISGDGYIPLKDQAIFATSISKKLLDDIQLVLSVFGIFSSINKQVAQYVYSQNKKMNSSMPYLLTIRGENINKFKENITLTLESKNDRLSQKNPKNKFYEKDIIPNIETKEWGNITIPRSKLDTYIQKSKYKDDHEILRKINNETIFYDRIIKIEEIESEYSHVYDLTVKNTRNFNIYNGLAMHDTFHHAGVGANSVVTTTGVPRMKEIVNVAKTIRTPSLSVYLKDEYSHDMVKAKTIKTQLEFTKMEEIVEKTQIIYESNKGSVSNSEDIEFIQTYQDFAEIVGYAQCTEDYLSKWVLRIEFDKEAMMNRNIFLSDIQETIMKNNSNEDNIQCIFSDDNAGNLILRIRVSEDQSDNDYLGFLQELEKILMSITIQGIPNIEKVQVTLKKKLDYQSNGSYLQTDEWYLGTECVNLIDALLNEYVDDTRTSSNDINEIFEILGIEAARNCIINEFLKIIEEYGINYRHIAILADLMTYKGSIMPIERHGINRSVDTGPIAKSTFEESTEILVKASTFAQCDKMTGVSANIMMGQFPNVGTNSFDVLFDETKFVNLLKSQNKENIPKVISEENKLDIVEDEIQNKFKDNLYKSVEDSFEFQFDITKNQESSINFHPIENLGIQVMKDSKSVSKSVKVKVKGKK